MRVSLAAVLLLCASAGTLALPRRLNGKDGGNIYALLVAGSNTWMNYRHQVFVCVHISDYVGCVIAYCATVVDLWKFLCRLICAMPIRSSRSMECRTKTLWSWCTMTLLTALSEYHFSLSTIDVSKSDIFRCLAKVPGLNPIICFLATAPFGRYIICKHSFTHSNPDQGVIINHVSA